MSLMQNGCSLDFLPCFSLRQPSVIRGQEGSSSVKRLVRLEDQMGLHNALSTADKGISEWPSVPPAVQGAGERSGLRWEWAWSTIPTILALLMMALAVLIPFPRFHAVANVLPPSEPGPWEQMDGWLKTLEEQDLIEEPAVEELLDKVAELRQQPEEEWFSHSSMEATDNLKESLQRDLKNLASDLNTAERNLSALENFSAEMSAEGKAALMKEYEEAVASLTSGNLALNDTLKKQLENLDPSQLSEMKMSELSKEQLESLKNSMCKACQAIGGMEGLSKKEGMGEGESLEAMLARLSREGKLGRGGITRGPGEAPLFFGEESDLNTNRIDAVQNQDFSRATPGDVIGTGETEHEIDETKGGVQRGGAISSAGSGGEAVWKESLMPSEKAVLKKYFK